MANYIDQDQQWLLNCLTATLDTNQEVRSFAEESLNQASFQSGFGGALSKVAVNKDLPLGLRQLAAVLLKQFIKKHWEEDGENFEQPIVSSEEKAHIRELLIQSLDDPHGKVCTAIGMAVASIAHYDCSENWPDLLPVLVKLISDQNNMNGVRGALRCLSLLSDDLDDMLVPALPVLFPCLHQIVSFPQIYDKSLRTKAISIVYSCTSVMGAMSAAYETETSALMIPMIKSWMGQFSALLQPPVQPDDPEDWSIRMEVLKCLNQFVQNFPGLTQAEFSVIVTPLWQTLVSSLKVYEVASIQGTVDPYLGRYDSDGTEKSLETLVIQLFEFWLTIVGSSRLVKVIARNMKELAYYTIAFMQVKEQQVRTWSFDANQFVADEDDNSYSCRVSGSLLLEEVVGCGCEDGIVAIVEAAQKHFSESQQAKTAGSAGWWRIREAVMFALASISESLLETVDLGPTRVILGNLLEQILTEDIGTGVNEFPFLHARAFSAVGNFTSLLNQRVLEQFLYAAIKAVGLDVPPPVKVGACRALSQLLPEANKGILQPHMMGLFSSLVDLLQQASDETLHLVLETLQVAIKAGHAVFASIEPAISPLILSMWALHSSDPFISIDALEVLEAINNAPGCTRALVTRVLPSIRPILEEPQQQPDGLVAASLDLLTMLLKSAPIDIVKAVYDVCFSHVILIILQSDDHSEMQNATECLAAFISGGRQELLAWSGDSCLTMKNLLDAASRLLDPDMESSGSLFVGCYILQLILHMPLEMAPHLRALATALIRRMQSCQIAGLKSSLLLIFARLVHMSSPNVEQFIDMLITLPAEGHENSLTYLMSAWTKQQVEIQGLYQIKVTTTALALLLSTRHVDLVKINVPGHLVESTVGITTRSKSKLVPDQWSWMPLPTKILALLADMLIEIKEQVLVADDEDSDWEEVQDGDDQNDQDLLYSSGATSYSKPKYLDATAKIFSEDQNDSYEDDLNKADPLNEINLASYVTDFLIRFSDSDRQFFDHLYQHLTQNQQAALQTVLKR